MSWRPLFALLSASLLVSGARGFDLAECDGDATLGNAGILLGWTAPTGTSLGSIVVDDQGTGPSGISPAATVARWQAARSSWQGVSNTNLVIPSVTTSTVSSTTLEASLSAGDGTRLWLVVTPTTTKSGPPPETGWAAITGTDPASFLGLTFTVFNTTSRRPVDADILINDDAPGGAARYYDRSVAPLPGLFDLEGIMTHELGHFLGAEHALLSSSLMFASASPGADLPFTSDDFGVVRFLYPDGSLTPLPQPDRNVLSLTSCTAAAPVIPVLGGGGGGGGGCRAGGMGGPGGVVPLVLVLLVATLPRLGLRFL